MLFPLPLAATFIQKRFRTQGSVDHNPKVWGLRHKEINGRRTPICKVMDGLYLIMILVHFTMQPFAPIILDTVCIIVQFINIIRHFLNIYKITSEYFESMPDTEVLVGILQVHVGYYE